MYLYICFCLLFKCFFIVCGVFLIGVIYDDLCKIIYFVRISDVELFNINGY